MIICHPLTISRLTMLDNSVEVDIKTSIVRKIYLYGYYIVIDESA